MAWRLCKWNDFKMVITLFIMGIWSLILLSNSEEDSLNEFATLLLLEDSILKELVWWCEFWEFNKLSLVCLF